MPYQLFHVMDCVWVDVLSGRSAPAVVKTDLNL